MGDHEPCPRCHRRGWLVYQWEHLSLGHMESRIEKCDRCGGVGYIPAVNTLTIRARELADTLPERLVDQHGEIISGAELAKVMYDLIEAIETKENSNAETE